MFMNKVSSFLSAHTHTRYQRLTGNHTRFLAGDIFIYYQCIAKMTVCYWQKKRFLIYRLAKKTKAINLDLEQSC